ncbi:hypothetical protein [Lacrimispora brassicae]
MSQQEQMKQMIRNEIQSISSLEERIILKELMEGVFLSLYGTNEQMYQRLEDRVMNDLAYDVNQYLIKTGLVERKFLDPTHHFMTVIQEQDWKEREITVKDVRQEIAEDGRCFLGTVFLKCDYLDIQNLMKNHHQALGTIRTDQDYEVSFSLEQNKSYLEKVEQFYHLFIKNGIPWQTVNCPYLFKMVDVYAVQIPTMCQEKEMIQSFHVDLGKLTSSVCYDLIPIWNVWHFKLDSVGFPLACKDHKSYEHEISIADYGEEFVYMVEGTLGITGVRQNGKKIMLISPKEKSQEWNVYSIRNGEEGKISKYTYPAMGNLRVDGFAERFQRKNGQVVKTKTELERVILGFNLEDYLEYLGCKILDGSELLTETYSMNPFLKDEIREDKRNKQLLLIFKPNDAGKASWLLRDLMSFVVSEVQELYPEYECGGKLE